MTGLAKAAKIWIVAIPVTRKIFFYIFLPYPDLLLNKIKKSILTGKLSQHILSNSCYRIH